MISELIRSSTRLRLDRVLLVDEHLARPAAGVQPRERLQLVDQVRGQDQGAEHVAGLRPSGAASSLAGDVDALDPRAELRLARAIDVELARRRSREPLLGGTWLRKATRGFSGPRESAKPISTAITIG